MFGPTSEAATQFGSLISDGSTYAIYEVKQMKSNGLLHMFWSVREHARVSGTVAVMNHLDAWKEAGLDVGTVLYQELALEGGAEGSGSAYIRVLPAETVQTSTIPTSTIPTSIVLTMSTDNAQSTAYNGSNCQCPE